MTLKKRHFYGCTVHIKQINHKLFNMMSPGSLFIFIRVQNLRPVQAIIDNYPSIQSWSWGPTARCIYV